MHFDGLKALTTEGRDHLAKGPVALILIEDEVEANSTLRHHLDCGFRTVVAFTPPDIALADDVERAVVRVDFDTRTDTACTEAVNACMGAAAGQWIYYCFNAEYLFFPFCENRTVGEMVAFVTEERRDTVLCYVVDLYAGDLETAPSAVNLDDAHLDKTGYYALQRRSRDGTIMERQLDFFGGLRWRFEEHIAATKRRIDRVALFRASEGLTLLPDHRLSNEELNTYACPWHHSVTASICSFRTAKALKRNPGSSFDIETFRWHNSAAFDWHSQQLLNLGLMEPGQWF